MKRRKPMSALGSPEGELALAQAAIYLAVAAKSQRRLQRLQSGQGRHRLASLVMMCLLICAMRPTKPDERPRPWQRLSLCPSRRSCLCSG